MGNTYISRQPIFNKDMKISGYKLLSEENVGASESHSINDKTAASLINNVLLVEFNTLSDNTRCYIKFTKNLLLKDSPLLFQNDKIIIELPGDTIIDEELISLCKKYKKLEYKIAIDDIDINNIGDIIPIIEYLDIAKVDFNLSAPDLQKKCISKYKDRLTFLACNVEANEDFELAKKLGYSFYQGAFYSKPINIGNSKIGSLSNNLLLILNELYKSESDFDIVTSAFERDIDLSYKVFRMVNSAYYGVRHQTNSLRNALIKIGSNELIRWVNILMIKGIETPENAELVKTTIIRGKMLAFLANATGNSISESEYFVCGMFSSIDVLLNDTMENIIEKLPFGEEVCSTLLGNQTQIKKSLDAVIEYEQGNWAAVNVYLREMNLENSTFASLYIDAIKWQKTLLKP